HAPTLLRRRYHRKLVVHFITSSVATGVLALRAPRSGRAPPRSCLPLPAITNQLILPWQIDDPTRLTPTNTLEFIHSSCLSLFYSRLSDRETRHSRPCWWSSPRPPCVSRPLVLSSVPASPT